jgi:hypothetical protein
MKFTHLASIMFLRLSPSPDLFDDSEPLAMTTPAVPLGPDPHLTPDPSALRPREEGQRVNLKTSNSSWRFSDL